MVQSEEPREPTLTEPVIDYEQLLRKYIQCVRAEEGADFIEHGNDYNRAHFTELEWDVLERLAEATPWLE